MKNVRKRTKIRNRYNQAPHLIQDTNGNVTTSQLETIKNMMWNGSGWYGFVGTISTSTTDVSLHEYFQKK